MLKYNVFDVHNAQFNLEPLECLFCGSEEVVYIQSVKDAVCECCGKWQIGESENA